MEGEKDIYRLVREMKPHLNEGEYVFTTVKDVSNIKREDTLCEFKENEGVTMVLERKKAEELGLPYKFIAAWITLKIHSSLDSVGLTAIFSTELAKHTISCNVIAGHFHDHIFVDIKDAKKAMEALTALSRNYSSSYR